MEYEPAKKLYTIKDLHWSFKETPCKQQWTAGTLDVTYFVSRKRKSSKKEWLH